MTFRCTKINHIWKVKDNIYTDEFFNSHAESAFKSGEAKIYNKIDGSCGAIIKTNNIWTIYQRYFDEKNKLKYNLSDGYIHIQKKYFLRRLDRKQKYLKLQNIVDQLYNIVDNSNLDKDYYSIELVGPDFNKTPNVFENQFILHEDQMVDLKFNSKQDLNEYFLKNPSEGLIICYKSRFWKIHSSKINPELSKDYIKPKTLKMKF
jgi:hypothetical protein